MSNPIMQWIPGLKAKAKCEKVEHCVVIFKVSKP